MTSLEQRARELRKLLHCFSHLFGLNTGRCYSWWDGNKLMMGFKCNGCETIQGVHEATHYVDKEIDERIKQLESEAGQ